MSETRAKGLRQAMASAGLDAVFVSNPKNVNYLTGFKTMMPGGVQGFGDPEGFVLVHKDRMDFLCDGRYIDGARTLPGVTAQLLESPIDAKTISAKIQSLVPAGTKTLGFEQDSMLYVDGVGLKENLKGIDMKPADSLFQGLRICKGKEEVEKVRKAQAITCDCFDHIAKFIKIGMTEREVALEIEMFLRRNSEGCSFDSIVSFGETGCHPHYIPDPNRKLAKGQLVLLDFGAVYEGYAGDMTRMLCMGKADERQREVYAQVLEAQLAGLAAIKPGATGHDVDMAVRGVFEKQGTLEHFLHGTGHGVGLAVHEPPRIRQGFETVLEPGMIFTVEPGLYYVGWGGVRIEDMVVATETGYENLTTASKDLLELPV